MVFARAESLGKGRNMIMSKDEYLITDEPLKALTIFAMPMILGSFFQQVYNMADSIIVGQFVGSSALAAVGACAALTNVFICVALGAGVGAGVLVSRYFGAGDYGKMKTIVSTSLISFLILSILLGVFGFVFSHFMMSLLQTPADILDEAVLYLRVYFVGFPFLFMYNILSTMFNSIGESKIPLGLLIFSSVLNIFLDILFIVPLHMGVAGAALATILSQALSAVLVLWVLMRTKDMHRLELRKIRFDGRMFHRIIRIGLPAGLQSVMYTSSNILIQSSVNALGTDTVAAWTAYSKIDSLFWMIVNAFGISITTFVGQNYGAGKMDRVHKGVRTCMGITAGATVLLSVILYNYASICYQLFTTDAQVVVIGEQILHFLVPTYFTYIAIEILSGTLRGIGDSWLPMIICCLGICALRVVWILTAVPLKNDILTIVFSYPLTWTVTSIAFIVYYLFFSRLKIVGRKR